MTPATPEERDQASACAALLSLGAPVQRALQARFEAMGQAEYALFPTTSSEAELRCALAVQKFAKGILKELESFRRRIDAKVSAEAQKSIDKSP